MQRVEKCWPSVAVALGFGAQGRGALSLWVSGQVSVRDIVSVSVVLSCPCH